jgi:hypothetical protein
MGNSGMRKRREISLLGAIVFCAAVYIAAKLLKIEEEAGN